LLFGEAVPPGREKPDGPGLCEGVEDGEVLGGVFGVGRHNLSAGLSLDGLFKLVFTGATREAGVWV
jgi:hypothetical protein